MCGIFGYVGVHEQAPQRVLAGLKKLEYRGYDSWGIAARQNSAVPPRLLVEKHVGKIGQATTTLPAGHAALGHTRWATHGGVTQANAHPHLDCQGRLAVIHNGIIENHAELRRELQASGHTFNSQTDTEVVCHLLEDELRREDLDEVPLAVGAAERELALVATGRWGDAPAGDDRSSTSRGVPSGESGGPCERLVQAVMRVFRRLDGLSAIGVLDPQLECIAAAKNGSPLVLGWGEDGNYLASDSAALLEHTRRLTFLDDGQAALIDASGAAVYDVASGHRLAEARIWEITWREETDGLEGYPHYMTKEIHEQPAVLRRLARERADDAQRLAEAIADANTVHLVGCGSAGHAARCGEYLFSRLASRQANCVVGSEFGYLADFLDSRSLVVGLSQSGETIDLLDSIKSAGRRGARLAALVNVEGSSLYRLVDQPILLSAGPERCVLATKSFTAKLGVLLMAAYAARGRLGEGQELLERAADEIQLFLSDGRAERLRALAERFAASQHLYVIGRGPSYPMALEAALKIKEVSYMHAEGFAGGELKHGVIALVEPGTPCIVLAPNDETFNAILSGAEEIKARGGYIIGISPFGSEVWDEHIQVNDVGEAASIVNAVPPQVLAYHLALQRGLDPDKPRNLAKSVTVK
jgi:glutamine---fructose-6-phosphate transaminase (isomerizing)